MLPFGVVEHRAGALVGHVHRGIQRLEQLDAFRCDVAEDLPPVRRRPLAHHVTRGLELVQQPGDPRCFFDHPVANGERRQPGLSRAAEDAKDVVLLNGDPVHFHHLREVALHHRRGAENIDHDLFRGRSKRSRLLDLVTKRAAALWHLCWAWWEPGERDEALLRNN